MRTWPISATCLSGLLVVACILILVACGKQQGERPPSRSVAKEQKETMPSMELPMGRMHLVARELARRVQMGDPQVTVNAARSLAYWVAKLPRQNMPAAAVAEVQELERRTAALTNKRGDPRAGYGALVQTCLRCHERYARKDGPAVLTLRERPLTLGP